VTAWVWNNGRMAYSGASGDGIKPGGFLKLACKRPSIWQIAGKVVRRKFQIRRAGSKKIPQIGFFYFVLWPTNAHLFLKLSHSYMFRHYRIIFRELVINTLQSYSRISVGNTIYWDQYTDSIYGQHTDWLHGNCSNKIILANFIVNRTILMF
jgi:hypothetical protein